MFINSHWLHNCTIKSENCFAPKQYIFSTQARTIITQKLASDVRCCAPNQSLKLRPAHTPCLLHVYVGWPISELSLPIPKLKRVSRPVSCVKFNLYLRDGVGSQHEWCQAVTVSYRGINQVAGFQNCVGHPPAFLFYHRMEKCVALMSGKLPVNPKFKYHIIEICFSIKIVNQKSIVVKMQVATVPIRTSLKQDFKRLLYVLTKSCQLKVSGFSQYMSLI